MAKDIKMTKGSEEVIINEKPSLGKKVSCIIPRNGDLIHIMYLKTISHLVKKMP